MEISAKDLEFETAVSKEWIITNGLGGYASSTILGLNTRKYHGLLVIPFGEPPFERKVLLSCLEERITSKQTFWLSSSESSKGIYPKGYEHLKGIRLDPFPSFLYSTPVASVRKTVFMPHRRNAVVLNYKIDCSHEIEFAVCPFVNNRGIHWLTHYGDVAFADRSGANEVEVFREDNPDEPFLILSSDAMEFVPLGVPEEAKWRRGFFYREERKRGYEATEDHYFSGSFKIRLREGKHEFNLLAVGGKDAREDYNTLFSGKRDELANLCEKTARRLNDLVQQSQLGGQWKYLVWAADSFLANGKIIAGYHWFGCWGRDALISIPGLLLVTRRYQEARNVLLDLAGRMRNGLIPNRFEGKAAEYTCLDASLFYIYALHKYLMYTDDQEMAENLWGACLKIVESCVAGVPGAHVEGDGLLWSELTTWMDAKLEMPVTPRRGKAVELNALWYNALRAMSSIARRIRRDFPFSPLAEKVKANFFSVFWNDGEKCLYDVVAEEKDTRLRPNQIFAVSLPFPVVDGRHAKKIVEAVRAELLTPFGLRSLARWEPEYRGEYRGNIVERDHAYHQGTVWSWLIGPFITAFVKTGGKRREAQSFLERLAGSHLAEAGLGTISEIFDGDEPHLPRGCISQAWSVGEVLRCFVEDVQGKRPEHERKYMR